MTSVTTLGDRWFGPVHWSIHSQPEAANAGMGAPRAEALREGRGLLLLPENDFSWSSWASSEDAVSEMDSIIASVAVGSIPRAQIGVVFAPSGPMQELSLSSGWAQRFVDLAERVDAALGPSEQT